MHSSLNTVQKVYKWQVCHDIQFGKTHNKATEVLNQFCAQVGFIPGLVHRSFHLLMFDPLMLGI